MAVRPILIAGDPILSTPAEPVTVFDADLAAFVEEMKASGFVADALKRSGQVADVAPAANK